MPKIKGNIRDICSRLQIVSASVDELTCKFVDTTGRKHIIHANITVGFNHFIDINS